MVAAVAVGVYFAIGGGGGGSSVADDGPHKLTTPAKVIDGEYQRMGGDRGPQAASLRRRQDLAASGITGAKSVDAIDSTIDRSDPDS